MDENGVGPRLGPMIVTAVLARATPDAAEQLGRRPRGKAGQRLDDSKKLVAFGDTGLGEAWARAVAARMGHDAKSPAELLAGLTLDDEKTLRAPCPRDHEPHCWATDGEAFGAEDELVGAVRGDLDRLAERGVTIVGANVAIVCTRRLNEGAARGLSRFDLDLHAMERLALKARADVGADVHATCGKVGGFDAYAEHFGPLAGWLHTVMCEGRARSEYRLPGLGVLAFVRDADARHQLVAMASLIGKWVRDLLMARIIRYYRAHDESLPLASGYHDPVTTRFVEQSVTARAAAGIEDLCFERRRVQLPVVP